MNVALGATSSELGVGQPVLETQRSRKLLHRCCLNKGDLVWVPFSLEEVPLDETISAYPLAIFFPETWAYIAVLSDSVAFDLALLSQVQDFLIGPLWIASNAMYFSSNASPRLFIIEGLAQSCDAECSAPQFGRYIRIRREVYAPLPSPKAFWLAGFNEHNTVAVCRRLVLATSYRPDHGIRQKSQGQGRTSNAYLGCLWPSKETVFSLFRGSSGQFIYASNGGNICDICPTPKKNHLGIEKNIWT